MKIKNYILSSIIGISTTFFAVAQNSFNLDNVTYHASAPATQELIEATLEIINVSNEAKNVHVMRTPISLVSGSLNNFCWGTNCYDPSVSVSTSPELINSTGLNESFKGDYYPEGNIGTSTIKYCFYNAADINDSICVTIRYSALDPNSAIKIAKTEDKSYMNNAYPNPANNMATIEYGVQKNAKEVKLVISNMIGSIVKEFNINNNKGLIVLPVSQMDNGFYFYSLQVDGNTVSTKRLIVSHQ
jgi:hypothetical protein